MDNSRLANIYPLGSEIALYVPGTVNGSCQADTTGHVQQVQTVFTRLFGGATAIQTTGTYAMQPQDDLPGCIVEETTTIVSSHCTTAELKEHLDEVLLLAETLLTELNQQAIAVRINGGLYFIS